MSHTHIDKESGVRFHYNSDFSGDIAIVMPADDPADKYGKRKRIDVPFEVIERFYKHAESLILLSAKEEKWNLEYDGSGDNMKIHLQEGNVVTEIDGETRTPREILSLEQGQSKSTA